MLYRVENVHISVSIRFFFPVIHIFVFCCVSSKLHKVFGAIDVAISNLHTLVYSFVFLWFWFWFGFRLGVRFLCVCVVFDVHSIDGIVIHFLFRRQQSWNDIEPLKRYRYKYDIENPSPHDSTFCLILFWCCTVGEFSLIGL